MRGRGLRILDEYEADFTSGETAILFCMHS